MNVDWHVQRCRAFQDWRELRIIQVLAARVRIDHRAMKAQLLHGALELERGGTWILWSYRSQRSQPVGMRLHRRRGLVVRQLGEFDCLGRIEELYAGRREQQELHGNSCSVHLAQTSLAQIKGLLHERWWRARRLALVRDTQMEDPSLSGLLLQVIEHPLTLGCSDLRQIEAFLNRDAARVAHRLRARRRDRAGNSARSYAAQYELSPVDCHGPPQAPAGIKTCILVT